MGLFDKLLGGKKDTDSGSVSKPAWERLETLDALEEALALSKEKTIVIFKHSTRCGISRMALNGFEREFDIENENLKLYFLDLIQFREISNEIAIKTGVWHESPQLLVIKNGKAVHHSSHGAISAEKIKDYL
ncbi:bacillithiol system redox-active protein YtxJ [Flavobacteriaceae bacterium M23B6Z8]